jgi:amino acid transporter
MIKKIKNILGVILFYSIIVTMLFIVSIRFDYLNNIYNQSNQSAELAYNK